MERIYFTYDLECYPNIFLFCGKFSNSDTIYMFEISDRVNEAEALYSFLTWLRDSGVEMVGFNNIGYDYFLIHEFLINPYAFNFYKAHQISNQIILGNGFDRIYVDKRIIPQIDLLKLCHFDNDAKRTSLKALQFAMRSDSIEDLPFDIRNLNDQEKYKLRAYNVHDVTETEKFLLRHTHLIEMRREYLEDGTLKGDVLNYSDVKIGTEYLISRIGKGKCYHGNNRPKQTIRSVIEFRKIILSKIYYRTENFEAVLEWFKKQSIYINSDKEKPSLEMKLAGLDFYFGIGGVHASADNKIFYSDDEYQIIDVDVTGMYPAVAIANRFSPEHLGDAFVVAYTQIKEDRARHEKGSPKSAALKLASNGAYGNSNNPFSALYDPQYTFSVTVNGQLQILQLVEMISLLPGTELIQANTDGITIRIKKDIIPWFRAWTAEWEKMTGLALEYVEYKRMWIRDVNNYIAEKMKGELKRKGAYWYPLEIKDYEGWYNKDFSNLASIKAAEKAMTHNWPVEAAIKMVTNPFDFMLRYKVPGGAKLYIGDVAQLKTVRYYVSNNGAPMKKVSPPKGELGQYKRANKLKDEFFKNIMKEIGKDVWDARIHTKNKSKYEIVETSVQSGWKVSECNVASKFDWNNIDWNYYIDEAKKIIIGVGNV